MRRTEMNIHISDYPAALRGLLSGACVFDSSCSEQAQVILIEKDGGYYLKTAPKGTLEREAELTRYFHTKGLAAAVVDYISDTRDWLVTERVPGEDCTDPAYLKHPERLCDTLAALLRTLHETDFTGCPVMNHTAGYLAFAEQNYRAGVYNPMGEGLSADEAWRVIEEGRSQLHTDVLLHGDYCLPNIILNGWDQAKLIDLGNGGVGDRHIDLFWGAWSLRYNLKTDCYRDRFFDAYGRDHIDPEMLRLIEIVEAFG